MKKQCKWFYRCWIIEDEQTMPRLTDEELLEEAKEELSRAYQLFSVVADSDLIDCMIYRMNAAEKRYAYLLKKIRESRQSYSRDTGTGNVHQGRGRCGNH